MSRDDGNPKIEESNKKDSAMRGFFLSFGYIRILNMLLKLNLRIMKLPKYKKESDEVLFFCSVKRLKRGLCSHAFPVVIFI